MTDARLSLIVRETRRRVGLTQEAAAERAGLSVDSWRRLELYRRTPLPPATFSAVAEALGVDVEWLLRETGYL